MSNLFQLFNDFIDIYSGNNTKQIAYIVDPTLCGYNGFLSVLKNTVITEHFSCCKSGTFIAWSGPGSSVGIASEYGLDGPGSNPDGDEIFRLSRPALGPTQPPVQWVPGLSRG